MSSRVRRLAHARGRVEVDRVVERAWLSFEGDVWVDDILRSILEIASGRSPERTRREAMYSSARLRSRLADKRETGTETELPGTPSYLRRKPTQGRGDS